MLDILLVAFNAVVKASPVGILEANEAVAAVKSLKFLACALQES